MVMNIEKQLDYWAENKQANWLAALRILLGLIIFLKGVFFIRNTEALYTMIANSSIDLYAVLIVHLVASAHLMGGLLIIFGLITRVAILFQLPILIGAIVFVNAQKGFFSIQSELSLSVFVTLLLMFFLVFGSGIFSVDEWMNKNKEADH